MVRAKAEAPGSGVQAGMRAQATAAKAPGFKAPSFKAPGFKAPSFKAPGFKMRVQDGGVQDARPKILRAKMAWPDHTDHNG